MNRGTTMKILLIAAALASISTSAKDFEVGEFFDGLKYSEFLRVNYVTKLFKASQPDGTYVRFYQVKGSRTIIGSTIKYHNEKYS